MEHNNKQHTRLMEEEDLGKRGMDDSILYAQVYTLCDCLKIKEKPNQDSVKDGDAKKLQIE